MLVLRWLSPGLGHFALSWAHLTWKASLELLRWWVRLCMELGTFGLDVPTSIFMIMSFLALLQMSLSLICLSRTVACQAHTSLRRQSWKSYRTMSPTITRYGGCISLWWTCGGHGSTILPRPEKSLTSFGSFGIVMTPVGWVHFGQMALNLHWGAVDLHMAMLWMAPSSRAI